MLHLLNSIIISKLLYSSFLKFFMHCLQKKSSNRNMGSTLIATLMLLLLRINDSHGLVIYVCSSHSDNVSSNCSLEYYANHIPKVNNTLLILDEGTHLLHLNESIRFDSLKNFTVIGSATSRGILNDSSQHIVTTIFCTGRSGLYFSNIQGLHISSFSIINCGGELMSDSSTSAALAVRDTFNASIENVIVKNCSHYGMMGFNIFGFSSIRNSLFISNAASSTNEPGGNMLLSWFQHHDVYDGCNHHCKDIHLFIDSCQFINGHGSQNRAGGLHIDYHNYCSTLQIVSITDSIFHENSGGNMAIVVHQTNQSNYNSFELHLIRSYIMNGMNKNKLGSGGLSFIFEVNANAVKNFYTHQVLSKYILVVNHSVFTGNINNHSSGAVHLNSSLMNWGKVFAVFYNSSFLNNSGYEGGALSLHLRSAFTNLFLSSCIFDGNFASWGGAILVHAEANPLQKVNTTSFQQTFKGTGIPMITLIQCVFQHNIAFESGSVLIVDNNSSIDRNSPNLVMNNSVIQQNRIIRRYDLINSSQQQANTDATIILKNINALINNSSFLKNIGSAIYVYKLELHFENFVVFGSNSAAKGGGIQLSNTKVHLSKGTQILFTKNQARYGGAVYALINDGCFVTAYSKACPFPGKVPQLIFVNNSAVYNGNNMYGSEVDSCLSNKDTAYMFNFHDKLSTTLPAVNDSATQICMCTIDKL